MKAPSHEIEIEPLSSHDDMLAARIVGKTVIAGGGLAILCNLIEFGL
jgi:hypothetical protein